MRGALPCINAVIPIGVVTRFAGSCESAEQQRDAAGHELCNLLVTNDLWNYTPLRPPYVGAMMFHVEHGSIHSWRGLVHQDTHSGMSTAR